MFPSWVFLIISGFWRMSSPRVNRHYAQHDFFPCSKKASKGLTSGKLTWSCNMLYFTLSLSVCLFSLFLFLSPAVTHPYLFSLSLEEEEEEKDLWKTIIMLLSRIQATYNSINATNKVSLFIYEKNTVGNNPRNYSLGVVCSACSRSAPACWLEIACWNLAVCVTLNLRFCRLPVDLQLKEK